MKQFLIAIAFLLLSACGHDSNTLPLPQPVSTPPPVQREEVTKIVWDSFTTNDDGTPACVKGYRIYCEQNLKGPEILFATVSIVTSYPLSDLGLSNGYWYCEVRAYNDKSETNASDVVHILSLDGKFYK